MFLRVRNRSSLSWLGWEKILKMAEAMEKSIHELKVEFMHLCVREKFKKAVLKLLSSFSGHIRNINLLFKKNL